MKYLHDRNIIIMYHHSIIYKNGIVNEIQINIGYAIEYFKDTVQRWDDKLSMYNLAHI